MTDVQITRSNDSWKFDPAADGYSDGAIFKTLSGAPSIVSENLVLNAAKIISLNGFKNGSVEMRLTVPTAPANGDSKYFGFAHNDNNALIGAYLFDITDNVLSAKIYDSVGTEILSKTINWSASWTNTLSTYRISISERNVYFAINDTIVARFEDSRDFDDGHISFRGPRCVKISNADTDNLLVSLITVF